MFCDFINKKDGFSADIARGAGRNLDLKGFQNL